MEEKEKEKLKNMEDKSTNWKVVLQFFSLFIKPIIVTVAL